jgi:hypothetical protein
MEEVATMNILAALFGIFRQRGLVNTIREGRPLASFIVTAMVFSVVGGLLYGFAMGIGLGMETAIKDAVKIGLIVVFSLAFAVPIFLLAYRLLGREERPGQVIAVPLTLVVTVAIVLAVTAPVVFLLSVLAGFSPEALYIHIVIVDVALLVGIYVAGTLVFHAFPAERGRLIVPNVVGFLMIAVILVVLIAFFGPFLAAWPSFSVGTDRLMDGLGIGVAEKVERALRVAGAADRVTYRFQTTNANGDLERDYTVTRVGDDYLIRVHLQAVPGGTVRKDRSIWLLDGAVYTDFADGRVLKTSQADLAPYLDPALPPAPFRLPDEFSQAGWRAREGGGVYIAIGTTLDRRQATVVLDAGTRRLKELTVGSAVPGVHAQTRIMELAQATFDRKGLEASLNQATVVGNVDRSDASMETYVQGEAFFAVRYPRTWRAGAWNAAQRRVEFRADCPVDEPCATLLVSVYDLAEGKGPQQYTEDLARSLELQPAYREVHASRTTVGDVTAGLVEYLFDRTVKGEIETTRHKEYIFVGQISRYHLDFSAPSDRFDTHRSLFAAMTGLFMYLQ